MDEQPPNVTYENYADLVLVTESPITEELKARLRHGKNMDKFVRSIQIFMGAAAMIDAWKKHIFYGTDFKVAMEEATKELPSNITPDLNKFIEFLQDDKNIRLVHSVIGVGSEAGELFKAIYVPANTGQKVDEVNLGEEFSDVTWYVGLASKLLDWPILKMFTKNIHKLHRRFAGKFFTNTHALNRNLAAERIILEA